MGAFAEDKDAMLDWRRLDVFAIVGLYGMASIDVAARPDCLAWLEKHHYRVEQIDCAKGMSGCVEDINRLFHWEQQFGYRFDGQNLDALNDGFEVDIPDAGGAVIEFNRPDLLWKLEPEFVLGVLNIASAHSHRHLASGRRFFNLLVMPKESPLIGQVFLQAGIPSPQTFNSLFRASA